MQKKPIDIVVAHQYRNYGIGYLGKLPWQDTDTDLKSFKTLTTTCAVAGKMNAVLMGRITYKSIGRPLPGRINVVISTTMKNDHPGVVVFKSIKEALPFLDCETDIDRIMVIGGSAIYNTFLTNPDLVKRIDRVHATVFHTEYPSDTFLNIQAINANFTQTTKTESRSQLGKFKITLISYTRKNLEEMNYLGLVKKVLDFGINRDSERTGVGTRAIFGERLEFDLEAGFPLLTTKFTPFKTVARELLWFLSGSTDAKVLQQQKVKIWDGNTSREFLDSRGLYNLPVGDLGSGYGFQWRHFGAPYTTCDQDYTGQGIDQIQKAIDLINTDPESRRIIVTAWNPAQENTTALMPCHCFFQFFVRNEFLDCMLYQRSCDIILGVPFNIASYSLLTYMVAAVTGKRPGRFIHVMGDTHIYNSHIENAKLLIDRIPYKFPRLCLTRVPASIFDFNVDDFEIKEYTSHSSIKFEMAV